MRMLLLAALLACLAVPASASNETAQSQAAQQAVNQVPYQSALRDRTDLEGPRLLMWPVTIYESEPCHARCEWAEPVGPIRGRDPFGENGAGRVDIRLWVDGTEVRFNTSGSVEQWGGMTMVMVKHWYQFPAYYFEPGLHAVTISSYVPKLGYNDVWTCELTVLEEAP